MKKSAAPLLELPVLVLDCQATHPDPVRGRLLELGWMKARASDGISPEPARVQSRLTGEHPEQLPPHIQKVTGLRAADFLQAVPEPEAWGSLRREAGKLAAALGEPACPAIIHFARYEKAYLEALHSRYSPDRPFPFEIICTHEIARRIHPDLPRRGLRAVAGFYGHTVPSPRRVTHHVTATIAIWFHLVRKLAEAGVENLGQLEEFLARTSCCYPGRRSYPMESDLRRAAPEGPGIYRMLRSNRDVLYVGKASSLKQRVNSYFQKQTGHSDHILEMLSQARDLEFDRTPSAVEAALLESDLIKQLEPPYNVALQRGERRLLFLSGDLSHRSEQIHPECPLGPAPANPVSQSLGAFLNWIRFGSEESLESFIGQAAPLLSYTRASENSLTLARQILFSRLERPLGIQPTVRRILQTGSILWLKRLAQRGVPADGPEEEDGTTHPAEASETADEEWDPEKTEGWLEHLLLQVGLLHRKARWMRALSNSTLSWSRGRSRGRTLLLRGGQVVSSDEWRPGQHTNPAPLACGSTEIDLATYDRLVVLTAEIKRLVRSGRQVQLDLGGRKALNEDRLRQVLRWL